MTERPHLAPHDAELVEADARAIYGRWIEHNWRGMSPPPPWERATALIREHCLRTAQDPYTMVAPRK